MQMSKLY